MARERPFTDALKAVRNALPGRDGGDGVGSTSRADRKHLQEWEKDPRAQEIWDNFKALSRAASPTDFIVRNLEMRRYVETVPGKDWHQEWHNLFVKSAKQIFDPRRSPAEAMAMLRVLCQDALRALYVHSRGRRPPHISRQNKTRKREDKTQADNNWRAHRLFIDVLGGFWHEQCGRWGDAEVAALTEVAFPGADVDAEQVRNVRRSIKAANKSTGELGL